ncbi:hypothetical protein ASE07_11345 [Noviherbaspirillum sp. Root189]|nr:hypothetical protein ASE07_11345 [Noviherbaspirillum sp. Root189]
MPWLIRRPPAFEKNFLTAQTGRKALNFDPCDEEKLENWLAMHNNESLQLELIGWQRSRPCRNIIVMSFCYVISESWASKK